MNTFTRRSAAEREDPRTGIWERAEYLGSGTERIFAFTHLPAEVRAAVLFCSPIYAEFTRNYRREVLMARRLAALGIAVQRFHYRGSGHSGGDPDRMTFETMVSDAHVAFERLMAASGPVPVGVFGARFGGLVAGATIRETSAASLVVWDPIVDPARYLREILRAVRISHLSESRDRDERVGSPATGSLDERVVHAMGHTIRLHLFEGGASLPLAEGAGDTTSSVLLVNLGSDPRRVRDVAEVEAALVQRGASVEVRTCRDAEPWWFTTGTIVSKDVLTEPIDITVDWLAEHLIGGSSADG